MNYFIRNLKNNVDFFLRQRLNFSRKNYFAPNESKNGLFTIIELIEREKELIENFNLEYLKSNSTRENYLENLYIIDLLDRYLEIDFQDNLKVLDVGCKNWIYVKGEYSLFKKYCKKLILDGIELDVNRLYSNFYTRGEVAKFHIKDLDAANYIAGDFLNHEEKYDYIIWILPFIVEYPLIKWGLPRKYFQPRKMLTHAYNSLNEGGKLFIINQGEAEYEVQKALCEELKISYKPLDKIQSDFLEYKNPRYSILIKKLNK